MIFRCDPNCMGFDFFNASTSFSMISNCFLCVWQSSSTSTATHEQRPGTGRSRAGTGGEGGGTVVEAGWAAAYAQVRASPSLRPSPRLSLRRLVAVSGDWRLVVPGGCPYGRSLKQKNWGSSGHPCPFPRRSEAGSNNRSEFIVCCGPVSAPVPQCPLSQIPRQPCRVPPLFCRWGCVIVCSVDEASRRAHPSPATQHHMSPSTAPPLSTYKGCT